MRSEEFLDEMTMRGGDFSALAAAFGKTNKDRWYVSGQHIGDIEEFVIKQHGIHYSVWDHDVLVAFSSLSNATNEVDDVWVNEEYRGQKIFSKLLWFYKTRLNKSPLLLGKVHSLIMQEVVKGLSRFKKSWSNVRTNEIEPFSVDTLDHFYSWGESTPWRLMLENTGDFSDWPMFTEGKSFIYESYSPYID